MPGDLIGGILFLFGAGYLAAVLRIAVDGLRYLKRRSKALLIWPGPRPPYFGVRVAIAVVSGALLVVALVVQRWPPTRVFGVAMMFVYYAGAVPCSRLIGRGFYDDGIWAESGFIPYASIGGVSWRQEPQPTLVIIARLRSLARRLIVPGRHYAAARRLLRDKIAAHDIHFSGTGLHLESHDEREDV